MTEALCRNLESFTAIIALLAATVATSASSTPVLDPAYGAVLQGAAADKLLSQCSRPAPEHVEGQWVPSSDQLHDLEMRLPQALEEALAKRKGNNAEASHIARQYAGFIAAGRKIIYVNAFTQRETEPPFPGRDPADWRHDAMIVCDGGAVFFGVEYDPETHTFSHFAFNGSMG